MTYIVLDMEWNQPFDARHMIRKPIKLIGEIIQIGAVKLDSTFKTIDTFKILVAPQYYTRMHKKVEKLTHISNDDLKYGLSFEQAISHFQKWCGNDFSFITWGWDDIGILQDNMRLYEIDSSWVPMTYNLQPIYNDQISKEGRQASLVEAMEKLNLNAAEAHDALNDARNTAQICLHLDMAYGFKIYDTFKRPSRKNDEEVLSITSSKNYRKREDALNDFELSHFSCAVCNKTVNCNKWIKQNRDKRVTIAKCTCGEEFFVRMRFRENTHNTFRVSVIVYPMSEEYRNYHKDLLEKQVLKEEKAKQYQNSL